MCFLDSIEEVFQKLNWRTRKCQRFCFGLHNCEFSEKMNIYRFVHQAFHLRLVQRLEPGHCPQELCVLLQGQRPAGLFHQSHSPPVFSAEASMCCDIPDHAKSGYYQTKRGYDLPSLLALLLPPTHFHGCRVFPHR